MEIKRYFPAVVVAFVAVLVGVGLNPTAAHAQKDNSGDSPPSIQLTYAMEALTTSVGPPSTCRHSYVYKDDRYDPNDRIGDVCFRPGGDEFWMRDLRADGWYIKMYGEIKGVTYLCYTTRTSSAGWQVCKGSRWAGNLPEGYEIVFSGSVWEWNQGGSPAWIKKRQGDEVHAWNL